jgi:small multidrug resistance pump
MWWIFVSAILTFGAVLGDFFIKTGSNNRGALALRWLLVGAIIYGSTAFGWFFVFRHLKLATISVLFALWSMLALTFVGVVIFHEKLHAFEILGMILALFSIILLTRFA